jgi:hypothetical protein
MAKASLVLPGGTKVTIDGSPDEVAMLLDRFSMKDAGSSPRRKATTKRRTGGKAEKATRVRPPGQMEYIRGLKDSSFFKTKREIGEVRDKLEEQAHIYKVTSLSTPLFRLVKNRELRRVKEDGLWKYVNP